MFEEETGIKVAKVERAGTQMKSQCEPEPLTGHLLVLLLTKILVIMIILRIWYIFGYIM